MAVEARRGCGFRKVGGIYLVGGTGGLPCCKLPILLTVCPCCGGGIKQSRGWQWIDPRPWLTAPPCTEGGRALVCPAADPAALGERVGLLWIGTAFYPTPEAFIQEGMTQGISRRIKAVPRGFKVGEHWVFLAHPSVKRSEVRHDDGTVETIWTGGIFRIFKPTAVEMIVTQSQSDDPDFMADLAKRNLTPVIVPDDDKDHQGTVYDTDDDELPLADASAPATP